MTDVIKTVTIVVYSLLYVVELSLTIYAFKKNIPLDWSYGSFLYQKTLSSIVVTRTSAFLLTLGIFYGGRADKYDYMDLMYACLVIVSCIYVGASIIKSRKDDAMTETKQG